MRNEKKKIKIGCIIIIIKELDMNYYYERKLNKK